jgi:hypothetical protein
MTLKQETRSVLNTKIHLIDSQIADYLQLNDIIIQIYDLITMIQTIPMDVNEFIALKVLILLSPGNHHLHHSFSLVFCY